MTGSSNGNDRNPVEALADDFMQRQRRGERPTLEEYCRRYPDLAGDIRDVFPVLIRMEDLRSDGPDDPTGDIAVHAVTRLTRIGDYHILREVGRGGMGVVYEAEQESLGRRVALKVLPDAAMADSKQVLRFQREARAAARLHHTNIVPVFGVGCDDGHHYYVMQFIPGMGLDAVLDELRRLRRSSGSAGAHAGRDRSGAAAVAEAILTGRFSLTDPLDSQSLPDTAAATVTASGFRSTAATAQNGVSSDTAPPPVSLPGAAADSLARSDPDRTFFRSVSRIGLQVAEALEYANRQGVLHRDVKPSNLLLDPKGNVWVADFGLAKAADADDLTHSGDIVGTVRYMAPERFQGKCDARSDVYALGLTLYELLALRPAFAAADRHELMRGVMSEQPERLRALVPNVPRDLETIIHKAIDREPARRYLTAGAMADDLQRFLDDKPITARRVSYTEQIWRWARRNRAVAALAIGLWLAFVAGMMGVTWQWRQAVANLRLADTANRKAQVRFDLAMQAVRAFTSGASEDVILKEKALKGLRKKLLGQSQQFYERLQSSLEGETDRGSRAALAEALFDAGSLYALVDTSEKALNAHREAIKIREALLRERPGDSVVQRDLGQSHLALAQIFESTSRIDAGRDELARAQGILAPLAQSHPDDGGARRLEAECESLEGRLLDRSGRAAEGSSSLQRARVLYEDLIRDAPAYTLPTTVDGPTEYRRGLVSVLDRLVMSVTGQGRREDALKCMEESHAVAEQLAAGSFADDSDRYRLGRSYLNSWYPHMNLDQWSEAKLAMEQALAVFIPLADANPSVASYRVDIASALNFISRYHGYRGDFTRARRSASHALTIIRALGPDRISAAGFEEALGEDHLGMCELQMGRIDEALAHSKHSVSLLDELVRIHPDYFWYKEEFSRVLLDLAFIELGAGHGEPALGAAIRVRNLIDPILLEDSHQNRGFLNIKGFALLIEGLINLRAGNAGTASQIGEQVVVMIENMTPPWVGGDQFCLGAAHTLFFATGRPAGRGRPAEPPGLRAHADRAVALVLDASRLGYQNPSATRMVLQVLGGRAELQALLMDQVFPADPFAPDPGANDDDPLAVARGPKP